MGIVTRQEEESGDIEDYRILTDLLVRQTGEGGGRWGSAPAGHISEGATLCALPKLPCALPDLLKLPSRLPLASQPLPSHPTPLPVFQLGWEKDGVQKKSGPLDCAKVRSQFSARTTKSGTVFRANDQDSGTIQHANETMSGHNFVGDR